MIYIGVDWASDHHDVCVMAEDGSVLTECRISDTLDGVNRLRSLASHHDDQSGAVAVGIETAHGLMPRALVVAGYEVYAVNPLAASRYRERHTVSGAKSDAADARMLANLVRTDRLNHRRYVPDSDLVEELRVLTRSHKDLIWAKQRHLNQLRTALRQYYPGIHVAFPELSSEALMVLRRAPTPAQGRTLTAAQILAALRQGGRQRRLRERADAVREALRLPQMETSPALTSAYGRTVSGEVAVLIALGDEIASLEAHVCQRFEQHSDAPILSSMPGLASVLGARLLAEFGDSPSRYVDAKARKGYAGTAPITRASGTKTLVLVRRARNNRLVDACSRWAFSSLTSSPGARRCYDAKRRRGQSHNEALRALANRWVGILHGCLQHHQTYSEQVAWPVPSEVAA